MKKIILICLGAFVSCFLNAQSSRDNIAVIVNATCFGCNIDKELSETIRSAYYAYFTSDLEKNELFKVVNRDNTDESIVGLGKMFAETDPGFKYWVDYTEKLKEQSKGLGANYLMLIDIFNYGNKTTGEGNIYFRFKIIHTESNAMTTFTIGRKINKFKDEQKFREETRELINSVSLEMMEKIDEVWNTTFAIVDMKGKKLTIASYTVFPLSEYQKINWFEWEEHMVGGQAYYEVRNLGKSKITGWEKKGSIFITTEEDFSSHDKQKIWGNIKPNYGMSNYTAFPTSFIEMPLESSDNGVVNFEINTKIYNAINQMPKHSLVQIASKELVYAEKNIQKGEEYMEGSVVDQNSSRKSDYIIKATDLGSSPEKYKVNIDLISSSTGKVLKTTVIDCTPGQFVNEVYEWLFVRIMPQCRVERSGNTVNVYTNARTTITDNFKYQLIEMRKVQMGSKTETIRVPLASLKFKKQLGQKIIFQLDEVLDDGFKKIDPSVIYYLGVPK